MYRLITSAKIDKKLKSASWIDGKKYKEYKNERCFAKK